MSVELGIPRKLEEAARVACSSSSVVRQVDMGQTEKGKFMLRVGIGFPAEKVILADRDLKDKYGLAAYTIAAFKAMGTTQVSHYQIDLDGEEVEVDGIACRVDNSSNVGVPGVSLVAETDVSDGYLDVSVWRDKDLASISSAAVRTPAKRDESAMPFTIGAAKEITIHIRPTSTHPG